jgi:opacity protein-like surface antigen
VKKFLLSAVLAASIATPALAQSYNPEFGTGNVRDMPQAERSNGDANSAYAHEPAPVQSSASPRHVQRWNSPTREQYQTAPNQDENY